MACIGTVDTIIPAPLLGTPNVLNFTINGKTCIIHTNGPTAGCTFTAYKQSCCCGSDRVGFEVPLLGYNTTPTVYTQCDDGVIPTFGGTKTQPPSHSTQTIGLPPQGTNKSSGSKKKASIVLLVAMLVATNGIF